MLLNLLQYLHFGFLAMKHVASYLPDQGWNLHPMHWKVKSFFLAGAGGGGEVLTTGSPGKLILLSLSAGSRREGTVTHMHLRTLSDVLERN